GEHEPRPKGRQPTALQVLVQDVGRVREEVRTVVVRRLRGELHHVLLELGARVLPREVRVRLVEAELRERAHHRRPRERLGEKDDVRVVAAHLADQPLPERERLRVRVVDAEDAHTVPDPVQHDVPQRLPQPTPALAVPVDVDDVLIALRRVLGVLDRAVGPVLEPLRVLPQPRVVGRALDREVERDLESELLRTRDEPVEVVDRPELRRDGVVTALLCADRPRAPRIALLRGQRVVAALAAGAPDGVDRRQVDDVEAELREPGKHALHAGEPAEGAREELVPRAEAGELAVDLDGVELAPRDAVTVRSGRSEAGLDVELRNAEQQRTLGELARKVFLPGFDLAPQLVPPRRGAIAPRLDDVLPAAAARHLEGAGEEVVPDRLERRGLEAARARLAVEDAGAEDVVAVADHGGGDVDALADRALDRKTAAVELRPNVLDADAGCR